jgi:pyridoxine kinase
MSDSLVPETRVLAVASHVSYTPNTSYVDQIINISPGCLWVCYLCLCGVIQSSDDNLQTDIFSSHVGNTMATFVMQSLGCEVAALNTVNFSMFLPLLCQAIQIQPFRGNSAGKFPIG